MLEVIGSDLLGSPGSEPLDELSTRERIALVLCFLGAGGWVGYGAWTVILAFAAS